jgi:hypothetical protein
LNAQRSGQNIKHVQHVDEVIFARHKWQSVTPNYYIPRTIVLARSILVVGYYTFELVFILNPTITNSNLVDNKYLTWLEQLHNLEQKPSHRFDFQ